MVPVLCFPDVFSNGFWQKIHQIHNTEEIGLDQKLFGLHSLRSGGASAATKSGIPDPDRWFKRHDRWLSENDDGFAKDKLEDRLRVYFL
jgi:hypothetical protein